MLFRKEKADLLGEGLVGGATEVANVIVEELGEHYDIVIRDDGRASQFLIEVMVFYMHLVDRSAHIHLGETSRTTFIDRYTDPD